MKTVFSILAKTFVVIMALLCIGVACIGCLPEWMYPVDQSKVSVQFLQENDPCTLKAINGGKNAVGYTSLSDAKNIASAVVYVHTDKENDLTGKLNKLNAKFAIAQSDSSAIVKAGQAAYDRLFGANGVITAGLFSVGGLLLGGFTWGKKVQSTLEASLYTPAEVETEKQNAVNVTTAELAKKLWNDPEVAKEVAERVRSALAKAGINDLAKVESIVQDETARSVANI